MLLAKMLVLLIEINQISMSWDGVVGVPEASAMVEYSLMSGKMDASGLA